MSEPNTLPEHRKLEPRIDLFFTPAAVTNERLKGYNAVVLDVLRAGTSITTALNNGARDILPAESINRAIELASELKREDVLLCGEREGKLIDGFHLGNSPADYSRERVRGRTLIFGTTNGTPAVVRASVAKSVFFGAFINMNTIVDAVAKLQEPFPLAILCAGKLDRFAIEDALCGGLFIERLKPRLQVDPILNDAARATELLYREFGNDFYTLLSNSDHGKYLIEIGMENDLGICSQDSVLPVVPTLQDGKLVKHNPTDAR